MAERSSPPRARPYLPAVASFAADTDTPRAYLERCLATIEARERDVVAFVSLDIDGARRSADQATARWRAGKPLSTIDGMAIGVKDVIETIDMPTEMGSALYAGWRSHRDSASVKALKEAGAVILGKTVTTEFAATEPGPTRNPWDLSRTPGGSSSGSAAGVAAGFFSAGLGTQVVGSILRPASYCGVVGFKPTVGAINRGGSHDHMSQSAQGVIAASIADAWQVLREIADRCGGDPGQPGLYGPARLTEAVPPRSLVVLETPGWAEASDAAMAAFEAACASLTTAGVRLRRRGDDPAVETAEQAITASMLLTRRINAFESRWPLNTYRDRGASKLSVTMLERVVEAEGIKLDEHRANLAARERIRGIYARLAEIGEACITLLGGQRGAGRLALDGAGDVRRHRLAARRAGGVAAGARLQRLAARAAGARLRAQGWRACRDGGGDRGYARW